VTESFHIRAAGAWRSITELWAGVGGSYKKIRQVWGSKNGAWHKVFPARPVLSSVVASGDTNPSLGTGDKVSLVFDRATNKPWDGSAVTGVQLDDLLELNNAHTWGTASATWTLVWNEAGTGLVVTAVTPAGSTVAINDTITCTELLNVKDATADSDACADVMAITGNWGVVPNLPAQNLVVTGNPFGGGTGASTATGPDWAEWHLPNCGGALRITAAGLAVPQSGVCGQGNGNVTGIDHGAAPLVGNYFVGTIVVHVSVTGTPYSDMTLAFNGG
jgi:hypothetical protein